MTKVAMVTNAAEVRPVSVFGILSLVFGCLSILGGFFFVVVPVLAMVFGGVCLRETRAVGGTKRGRWMGMAGLGLGSVALLVGGWYVWQITR